jgi:Flp pilus assembly protein TadG
MRRFPTGLVPARHIENGQSLVELAFAMPVVLLLLLGTVDLGRAFYTYVAITNAAREGARFGASFPTNNSGIRDRVRLEIIGTNLSIGDDQIPDPTCNEYVDDSTVMGGGISCGATVAGDYITVRVNYPFQFLTIYLLGIGEITMSNAATMAIY